MKFLFIAFLMLLPGTASALSGGQACSELERRLYYRAMDITCSYVIVDGNNAYTVIINSTPMDRPSTLGLIMSGVLGADQYVPTRTAAVAVVVGRMTYAWTMPKLRTCTKHVGVDGEAFENCVLRTAKVTKQ